MGNFEFFHRRHFSSAQFLKLAFNPIRRSVSHCVTLCHTVSHCVTLCHTVCHTVCHIVCHIVSHCVSHCVTLCVYGNAGALLKPSPDTRFRILCFFSFYQFSSLTVFMFNIRRSECCSPTTPAVYSLV